jgi:hypothetical protein
VAFTPLLRNTSVLCTSLCPQLSGGERSYTTVAFTLALGGQTDMPFRAMDEFDVFMDAINRRVAMQNLFSFAKDNPELQFIFLTPQDISAVEDARQACQAAGQLIPEGFVRVVQMRPAHTLPSAPQAFQWAAGAQLARQQRQACAALSQPTAPQQTILLYQYPCSVPLFETQ